MKDELILTSEDQVRAVQDVGFLSRFVEPASPSQVARELGIAANLAHHHAKKHADLELLTEVEREGGRVYYQLAAKMFKHGRDLTASLNPEMAFGLNISLLTDKFLAAFERSDRLVEGNDPDWHIYTFVGQEPSPAPATDHPPETHPAHFQTRTVRLSQARYLALVRQIGKLLETTEADGKADKNTCTLAFLAFDGELQKGVRGGHRVSSFVPPMSK